MLELEEYVWRYEQGHTLQQFGLPLPTARSSQRGNRALGALLRLNSRDLGEYVQQHLPLLNDGQRDAFDQVVRALNANQVSPPSLACLHLRSLTTTPCHPRRVASSSWMAPGAPARRLCTSCC